MGRFRASWLASVMPFMVILPGCGGGGGGSYSSASTAGPAGTLDSTFGTNGHVITDLGGSGADSGSGMAFQSDGKIVVVGSGYNGNNDDFGVVRYNPDGTLDTSFGTGGKVLTDFAHNTNFANSVAVQPDDQKVVVVGRFFGDGNQSFGMVRYNTDGTLDSTFGIAGKVITDMSSGGHDEARGVAIQADGRIVVVGLAGSSPTYLAVARYNTGGSLDASFGTAGRSLTDADAGGTSIAYDVAIQTDQKIVVAGLARNFGTPRMILARFGTNGSLDATFDTDGIVAVALPGAAGMSALAIQNDGRILMAGSVLGVMAPFPYGFALVRVTSSGSLDTTFGTGGNVITAIGTVDDRIQDLALQSDGRIVAAGYSDDGTHKKFTLARYAADGSLDATFGTGGTMTEAVGAGDSQAFAVAIQSDHKIVAAGVAEGTVTDFSLIRVWP